MSSSLLMRLLKSDGLGRSEKEMGRGCRVVLLPLPRFFPMPHTRGSLLAPLPSTDDAASDASSTLASIPSPRMAVADPPEASKTKAIIITSASSTRPFPDASDMQSLDDLLENITHVEKRTAFTRQRAGVSPRNLATRQAKEVSRLLDNLSLRPEYDRQRHNESDTLTGLVDRLMRASDSAAHTPLSLHRIPQRVPLLPNSKLVKKLEQAKFITVLDRMSSRRLTKQDYLPPTLASAEALADIADQLAALDPAMDARFLAQRYPLHGRKAHTLFLDGVRKRLDRAGHRLSTQDAEWPQHRADLCNSVYRFSSHRRLSLEELRTVDNAMHAADRELKDQQTALHKRKQKVRFSMPANFVYPGSTNKES